MNRFLKILESARDNKWCMNLYCTTCGATEFRSAMKQLGDELADELASLDLSVLTEMPNWDETIRLGLDDIRKADLMDRVLSAWLLLASVTKSFSRREKVAEGRMRGGGRAVCSFPREQYEDFAQGYQHDNLGSLFILYQ
jgi:hypothetical protein